MTDADPSTVPLQSLARVTPYGAPASILERVLIVEVDWVLEEELAHL